MQKERDREREKKYVEVRVKAGWWCTRPARSLRMFNQQKHPEFLLVELLEFPPPAEGWFRSSVMFPVSEEIDVEIFQRRENGVIHAVADNRTTSNKKRQISSFFSCFSSPEWLAVLFKRSFEALQLDSAEKWTIWKKRENSLRVIVFGESS